MSDYTSQDLLSNVRIITDFLNKPLSDDLVILIAEQCTFKGMMKNVQSYFLRGKEDGPKLLQKGVVGNLSWTLNCDTSEFYALHGLYESYHLSQTVTVVNFIYNNFI